jgi:hypothetical protein
VNPTTETTGDPPPGVATQAPPYLGFGLSLLCFAALYFVMRRWFTRLAGEG